MLCFYLNVVFVICLSMYTNFVFLCFCLFIVNLPLLLINVLPNLPWLQQNTLHLHYSTNVDNIRLNFGLPTLVYYVIWKTMWEQLSKTFSEPTTTRAARKSPIRVRIVFRALHINFVPHHILLHLHCQMLCHR